MPSSRLTRYLLEIHPTTARELVTALDGWDVPDRKHGSAHVERLQAAAVLASDGGPEALRDFIVLGDQDWRDLLVAGDLASADWEKRLRAILKKR